MKTPNLRLRLSMKLSMKLSTKLSTKLSRSETPSRPSRSLFVLLSILVQDHPIFPLS